MEKKALLHSGKAKSVYQTRDPDLVVMHYRDDATAFNAEKKASLQDKGRVNNLFNAFIMEKLIFEGIPTHFIETLNDRESLVKSLEIIPVECVIRNYAAGSICKRLGFENGQKFHRPVREFFYKDDALKDPLIGEDHILAFNWAKASELNEIKRLSDLTNKILIKLFDDAGMILVDFKLEFGRHHDQLLLGDEFTPDGCRLWDKETKKIMDKDRFRQDLGDVIETYKEVAKRLNIPKLS